MASYCVQADILKLLPESTLIRLTDDEDSGSINADRVTEAIASAAEEMDSYLGVKYDLPITSTVPLLGKINVDMAIFNLYSRIKETVPETRQTRYERAIKLLEDIRDGKLSPGIQPPPDPPDSGDVEGAMQISVRDKDFDSTTMDKY